jgi:hypothetical protein
MGDHEQADATTHPREVDPYDIGAGGEIGEDPDSDQDGLTDVFEKLAGTSDTLAGTDATALSDAPEAVSSNTDSLSGDSGFDGLTDGPETSYQSDPLSDIHGGPWNQGLPGGGGPQPDQGGLAAPQPNPGGLGGPQPGQAGFGGPQPDQDAVDPADSDHLDNTGVLDLN